MAFDTLTYSKKLQQAGFTATQAEALHGLIEETRAANSDNESLRQYIARLENRSEQQTAVAHQDRKIWVAGFVVVTAIIIGILLRLL